MRSPHKLDIHGYLYQKEVSFQTCRRMTLFYVSISSDAHMLAHIDRFTSVSITMHWEWSSSWCWHIYIWSTVDLELKRLFCSNPSRTPFWIYSREVLWTTDKTHLRFLMETRARFWTEPLQIGWGVRMVLLACCPGVPTCYRRHS